MLFRSACFEIGEQELVMETVDGEAAGSDGMSSFQSLATAVAAQVGTGNLAGAATAIAAGGPGAIFWMWMSAFFGMATVYSEEIAWTNCLAETHEKNGPANHP